MLRLKMRPHEIIETLKGKGYKITPTTVYKDLQYLRRKVREWYYDQAQCDILTAHKLSIEVMEERQRKLMIIEADASQPAKDRIAASVAIAEIEALIHDWLPVTRKLMEISESPKAESGQ